MVKRIWFQFTRKSQDEADPTEKTDKSGGAASSFMTEAIRPAPALNRGQRATKLEPEVDSRGSESQLIRPDVPETTSQRVEERNATGTSLRLAGTLWVHPTGEYRRILMTADRELKSGNARGVPQVLPAGLHLDVGEMRWIGGRLTAVHEETRSELSPDLPYSATAIVRFAYVALQVGELIFQAPGGGDASERRIHDPFAWGNALLRQTQISGTFFDDRFYVEQLELERLQLIQGEQAWVGQLAQIVGSAYEGPAGRNLIQQARTASSFADPLAIVRRVAQRYARSIQVK